jgi:hypothetical protein
MLLDHSTSMRGDVSKIDSLLCVILFSPAIYVEIYIVSRHKIDRLYFLSCIVILLMVDFQSSKELQF